MTALYSTLILLLFQTGADILFFLYLSVILSTFFVQTKKVPKKTAALVFSSERTVIRSGHFLARD